MRLIAEKELFKNPKITAPEVARMLAMPPYQLSALLNKEEGTRFPELINRFRIEYALNQLKCGKNKDMSIEGIALDSGFASRSTFYEVLKKSMGITPTEFLRSLEDSSSQAV
jgi:AraC-like DNA-binding protein